MVVVGVGVVVGLDPPDPPLEKFRVFFSSPTPIFALVVSLWVSSRGILMVFEAPGNSNVHVWSSWAVV